MENFEEYFDVTLNPFTKEIVLKHYTDEDGYYEKELSYNEIDEWQSFSTLKGKTFDLHVHYDQEMNVYIYEIDPSLDEQIYTGSMKVNLTIKLNEK